MGERVTDGTKSEGRTVMARIGDERIAPRRKPADLFLVTIAKELVELRETPPERPDGIAIIWFVALMAEQMRFPNSVCCTLYAICRAIALVLNSYYRLG
jgi:hypothetical protein